MSANENNVGKSWISLTFIQKTEPRNEKIDALSKHPPENIILAPLEKYEKDEIKGSYTNFLKPYLYITLLVLLLEVDEDGKWFKNFFEMSKSPLNGHTAVGTPAVDGKMLQKM